MQGPGASTPNSRAVVRGQGNYDVVTTVARGQGTVERPPPGQARPVDPDREARAKPDLSGGRLRGSEAQENGEGDPHYTVMGDDARPAQCSPPGHDSLMEQGGPDALMQPDAGTRGTAAARPCALDERRHRVPDVSVLGTFGSGTHDDHPDAVHLVCPEGAGGEWPDMSELQLSCPARDVGGRGQVMSEIRRGQTTPTAGVSLPTTTATTNARPSVPGSRRGACLTRVGGAPQTDTDNTVVQSGDTATGTNHGGRQSANTGSQLTAAEVGDYGRAAHMPQAPADFSAPTQITLGTDFSGMEAAGLALQDLCPYQHVWATDIMQEAREFLAMNFSICSIHTDVLRRPVPKRPVVLYAAGPPCQGIAPCGKRECWSDPRSRLYLQAIFAIEQNRPTTFLLENSHNLSTIDEGRLVQQITTRLRNAGYAVYSSVLNVLDLGLPHNRSRLLIVGIRAGSQRAEFRWPKRIEPIRLSDLLGLRAHDPAHPSLRPDSTTAAATVELACAAAADMGTAGDWIVADHLSRQYMPQPRPSHHCPGMTSGKRNGHWIGSRGR